MTCRQIIMASPTGTLSEGTTVDLTTTISEPGIYHMSRLVLSVAAGNEALGSPDVYLLDDLNVSSLTVNGSIEYIRGRNSVVAPAGAFSAYRGLQNLPLPDLQVNSGDTIAVTIGSEAANTGTLDASMACAFSPKARRGGVNEPAPHSTALCTYAGSTVTQLAAGATGSITMTFDEAGIFSLQSMQARGVNDLTGTPALTDYWDGLPFLEIGAIQLPNGNDIVVGQNSAVLNGSFLASSRRKYTWADLGAIPVNGGDTLVFSSCTNSGPDVTNFSFGGRFWPAGATVARCVY
jgi:hypothetical protein